MMKKTLLGAILLAGFAAGTLSAFEVTKATVITIGEKAPESTILAANEFAKYVGKVSGITPKIVKGKSKAASQVIVGTLADVKTLPAAAARPAFIKLSLEKSRNSTAANTPSMPMSGWGSTSAAAGKKGISPLWMMWL